MAWRDKHTTSLNEEMLLIICVVATCIFILEQCLSGSDGFMALGGRQCSFLISILCLQVPLNICQTDYPFSKGVLLKLWHPAESSSELFQNTHVEILLTLAESGVGSMHVVLGGKKSLGYFYLYQRQRTSVVNSSPCQCTGSGVSAMATY